MATKFAISAPEPSPTCWACRRRSRRSGGSVAGSAAPVTAGGEKQQAGNQHQQRQGLGKAQGHSSSGMRLFAPEYAEKALADRGFDGVDTYRSEVLRGL